jgi:hypothetical protein
MLSTTKVKLRNSFCIIKDITKHNFFFLQRTISTLGLNKKPPFWGKQEAFYLPCYLIPSIQKGFPATIHLNEPYIGLPTSIQIFADYCAV